MSAPRPTRSPTWIPAWFTRTRRRLWLLLMLAFAAVLFLIALADAAFGQTQGTALCGDRQEIAARLEAGFGERLAATGLTDSGALLEVLAAPSGSWTLLLTRPGGPACVMATGQGWRARPVSGDAES